MHVTGGQYKGHKIIIPDCAKPTLSKTRESVFNILYSIFENFEGKIFLDLFSGSGIMSLEALSRGFITISVDKNKKAILTVKENIKIAKNGYEVILSDSLKFIEKTSVSPDVIYIDPPWDVDYRVILHSVLKKFKTSIVVVEYDKKRADEFAQIYAQTITPFKEKVYGRCKLDFIKQGL